MHIMCKDHYTVNSQSPLPQPTGQWSAAQCESHCGAAQQTSITTEQHDSSSNKQQQQQQREYHINS